MELSTPYASCSERCGSASLERTRLYLTAVPAWWQGRRCLSVSSPAKVARQPMGNHVFPQYLPDIHLRLVQGRLSTIRIRVSGARFFFHVPLTCGVPVCGVLHCQLYSDSRFLGFCGHWRGPASRSLKTRLFVEFGDSVRLSSWILCRRVKLHQNLLSRCSATQCSLFSCANSKYGILIGRYVSAVFEASEERRRLLVFVRYSQQEDLSAARSRG